MPSDRFPGPNINRLVENDPQIVKIPLEKVDWGTRPSIQAMGRKPGDNDMTIKHVGK